MPACCTLAALRRRELEVRTRKTKHEPQVWGGGSAAASLSFRNLPSSERGGDGVLPLSPVCLRAAMLVMLRFAARLAAAVPGGLVV